MLDSRGPWAYFGRGGTRNVRFTQKVAEAIAEGTAIPTIPTPSGTVRLRDLCTSAVECGSSPVVRSTSIAPKGTSMRRVCVVGAGVSGLPAVKACLEEGLEVVCFEATSDLGGLWNYRPERTDDGGTVMRTTVVNTSKEMMAYSDFPPPEDYPNFMHHSLVLDYIRDYAERFDLLRHVRFGTKVHKVEKINDKWHVHVGDGNVEEFDDAMLCTGHHSIPVFPQIRGAERFQGKMMHAKEYHDYRGFEDKNVFLVGIGNSALDISVDLAKIAKSVTISTRRGSWIFNRVAEGGMPYDVLLMTRYHDFMMETIPWTVANDWMEHRLQQRMDHDTYGLRPDHRFFQQHPTVNDALANLLASGMITITEDVESIDASGVSVRGGRRFEADVVILCTGYSFGFDYLHPKELIPVHEHQCDLYKFVFPPRETSLAVIGLIQPIGSVAPIAEMQSRWAARCFAGRSVLPSAPEMLEDVALKRSLMARRYFKSTKHTMQVDYLKYMDEIAELVGCKPPLDQIFYSDPKFWWRLWKGANVPYVYRLVGPHSWEGAREAIEETPWRVKRPLKNRECRMRKHKKRGVLNEYFRYASMKWLSGWTVLLLCTGLWVFCSGFGAVSPVAYCLYVLLFFVLFTFMLLWFELQYNMSTIL
ncbi:hypothetical protein QR680_005739 [Steinernema hermaphroditum]|uniref:Flavin-containing monooxygenase n=1 Tax=Steinernema hermaphroditum TaxID=289476 RepID=A0AA39LVZ2_9BILA|nr:hypothetical protein QR680_005739 [Steinernema hermaphroditum]